MEGESSVACGGPSLSRYRLLPVLPGMASCGRPVNPRDWFSALSGVGGHSYLVSGLSLPIALLFTEFPFNRGVGALFKGNACA